MLASDDPALSLGAPMADLASHTTPHSIVSLQYDSAGVTLVWSDGRRSRFHVLWLRDNCACRECRHPLALERTYIFVDHAPPILTSAKIDIGGELEVRFQQGTESHVSRYLHGWLRTLDRVESLARAGEHLPRPWDNGIADRLTRVDYSRYMGDRDGVRAWISALKVHGIVL